MNQESTSMYIISPMVGCMVVPFREKMKQLLTCSAMHCAEDTFSLKSALSKATQRALTLSLQTWSHNSCSSFDIGVFLLILVMLNLHRNVTSPCSRHLLRSFIKFSSFFVVAEHRKWFSLYYPLMLTTENTKQIVLENIFHCSVNIEQFNNLITFLINC